jgi:hypothetical protein
MKKLLIAGAAALAASPALAHHPLNGMPMETLAHGLMSGVGHPVLGFDHLFFVALMGVAAVFTGHKLLAPAAYIGAMLAGCALIYAGVALPAVEGVIVASLIVLGGIVLSGRGLGLTPALDARQDPRHDRHRLSRRRKDDADPPHADPERRRPPHRADHQRIRRPRRRRRDPARLRDRDLPGRGYRRALQRLHLLHRRRRLHPDDGKAPERAPTRPTTS